MELLSIFILWIHPAFWSRDTVMYLVLWAFTSSPISLVFTTDTFQNKLQHQNSPEVCWVMFLLQPSKCVQKNANLLATNCSKYNKTQHFTINHWISQSQLPASRLQTLLSILHLAVGSEHFWYFCIYCPSRHKITVLQIVHSYLKLRQISLYPPYRARIAYLVKQLGWCLTTKESLFNFQ